MPDWKPWFAWRPVPLINGGLAWLQVVEWKSVDKLKAYGNGLYTVRSAVYRMPLN